MLNLFFDVRVSGQVGPKILKVGTVIVRENLSKSTLPQLWTKTWKLVQMFFVVIESFGPKGQRFQGQDTQPTVTETQATITETQATVTNTQATATDAQPIVTDTQTTKLEQKGLIKFQKLPEVFHSMDTLVRHGHHVLFDNEMVISVIIGRDFSKSGRCDYYSSRERYLPVVLSMIGQKNSPLVPELSKKIWSMTESGLYNKWFDLGVPNSTACTYPPTKITQSASFSLAHFWGVFVVLAAGHSLSLLVICLELLLRHVLASDVHRSSMELTSTMTALPH
ncbi:uncharacterized protein LOC121873898 [Homarus americanus]|uniref:uncharacterized protein LOC121873898 n=1 Tax=Homarus americanus TaxID=6706 RepID=UPI001C4957A0|nr:uncharacterized protein LOC121873898 [Homarus americanus]